MIDMQSRITNALNRAQEIMPTKTKSGITNALNGVQEIVPTKEKFGLFTSSKDYYELKTRIHDRLLDVMDLTIIGSMDETILRQEIRKLVERILSENHSNVPLNMTERETLFREIHNEVMGLGPLEPFMQDPAVADILVNTHRHIYVERFGKLESTEAGFKDEAHLRRIIDKIASAVGRRIDESTPMVDARLADGSRVNAIIPPLAIDGSILSIRRFSVDPLEMEDLLTLRALTPEIGELMKGIVKARLNVLISGGTGTGKTTMLNVLSRFIPSNERVVTIEDSAELQLKQEHVVRLETRPPNIEGKGEVTQRDLVKNSLRMRPDRIIVGEVRGSEVLDMFQAMNTGHDGSLPPRCPDEDGNPGGPQRFHGCPRVHPQVHRFRFECDYPIVSYGGWKPESHQSPGNHRDGRGCRYPPGDLFL